MLLSTLLFALALSPADPGAGLLSFDELQARLTAPSLRLLDARPRAAYDAGHLPGAVHVDPKQFEELAKRPGALTDAKLWTDVLEPLGIKPDSEVVVYDANRQLDAARLWWLLRYLGVPRAALLDGSFPLWKEQNRPVTAEVPSIPPAVFPVAFQADRHATRDQVRAALGDPAQQILDARSDPEFNGVEARSKRGGHIPKACHLEWVNMIDPQGRFRPLEELREKLAQAGVTPDRPVITHCQGGGRASVNAFVLERLGYPTRNYYLGWSDWGNAPDDFPIESAPK